MALKLLTPAQREEGHRKFEEKYASPEVITKNVQHAALIDTPVMFPWRGRMFELDPISVPDGFVVSELVNRWDKEVVGKRTPEALEAGKDIFGKGVAVLQRLARPQGIWRWLWNSRLSNRTKTFTDATEAEFVNLMRFLLLCRMR